MVADPAPVETADAVLQVQEPDPHQAEAGLPEEVEDAGLHLDLAEEPTSEEPQAQASELDQSTGHPAGQEEPTLRLEMESETPAEASEPAQQDHRNLETQARASGREDSAAEKPFRCQDAARSIDPIQISIAMENSSAKVPMESCSSDHQPPHEQVQTEEE